MVSEQKRCTGHCCEMFVLPVSYEAMQSKEWQEKSLDGDILADMVIPLDVPASEGFHYFTCRHFDGTNCMNYENRPYTCHRYPENNKCSNAGCTSEFASNDEDACFTHKPEDIELLRNQTTNHKGR